MTFSAHLPRKILVIKHGALGDFVNALGVFKGIRTHHPEDHITLLTTPPYHSFGEKTGYFDQIRTDRRPPLWNLGAWLELRSWFWRKNFDRVYDLQNSNRTSAYFRFWRLGKALSMPEWSGVAPGCSHPQTRPDRGKLHTFDRFEDQLGAIGLHNIPQPDVSWCTEAITPFELPQSYALLIPGSSKGGVRKRWPGTHYATLANMLAKESITPVLVGGPDDAETISNIKVLSPEAIDLSGKTTLFELISLAYGSKVIVGNDTGPTHLAAATRQPTIVAWSDFSDPKIYGPRYDTVQILKEAQLEDLTPQRVLSAIHKILEH